MSPDYLRDVTESGGYNHTDQVLILLYFTIDYLLTVCLENGLDYKL